MSEFLNINIGLIVLTALVSYQAFKDTILFSKLMFNPYLIHHQKQIHRIITHGFVHADTPHLLFNMFTLYLFGGHIEYVFSELFGSIGWLYYLLLYIGGVIFSSFSSYIKYYNKPNYNAIGASGAVSAVVFAFILIFPTQKIGLFFIPPFIPGWIFGFLYLAYSHWMSKKQMDNIGHEAHFWGAVFGFLFTLFLKPELFQNFINQVIIK
jgi:membrane associated rhomboid family serine protease